MNNEFPIYSIQEFQYEHLESDFYANYVNIHVKRHHFTNLPHKHDFYLVILFTKGSGTHEIDFESLPVEPGTLFILKPGQMHFWDLSNDIDGYVFFHSKEFYDKQFSKSRLNDFEFISSFQSTPAIKIKQNKLQIIEALMLELVLENKSSEKLKWLKIQTLVTLIYINIAREYSPIYKPGSSVYLKKIDTFEALIETNFKKLKLPKQYASLMHISEKHLNRVSKTCLNKTSTQVIGERIILEAKRMLMHSENNVNQISDELGFSDSSYFIRFFKKKTGVTPLVFLNTYNKG